MITIAIIGSSGSKGNVIFTKSKIDKMLSIVEEMIEKCGYNWNNIELFSGGSSGGDHIAILLALKYKCKLTLYLPCEFINGEFLDNKKYNYTENCGKLLNKLHFNFSQQIGRPTLLDIFDVLKLDSTKYEIFDGFLSRNVSVSKAIVIIAFTCSSTGEPIDGGTKHTWNLAKTKYKNHFDISNF